MSNETDTDGYCAATNGARCYTLAIREMRLQKIREGIYQPNMDDPEEVEAARQCGWIVDAQPHRVSA